MEAELAVSLVVMISVTLYALLGGADFGAGVWEFNTAIQTSEKERALIYRAIGPVWEANHVWLIFVIVLIQTGFPTAFAALGRALWIPLLLALVGIVFRGAGFAFRSHATDSVWQQKIWGAVFAIASTAAPFFLGASVGAIASGSLPVNPNGADYILGWIHPMSIFSAFFAVGVCAYLSSVYLTREAHLEGDPNLEKAWKLRAIGTGALMGILAVAGIAVMAASAPGLWEGFRHRAWPIVGISFVGGFSSLWAIWKDRFTLAVCGAALAVAAVIWGWAVGQYPALIPPEITIEGSKAPQTVLQAMIWCIGIGSLLLLPSLGCLFFLFKRKRPPN